MVLVLVLFAVALSFVRRNRRSFATIQPHYASGDANCCPSSFRVRRFTWTGTHFARGQTRKLKTRTPPRRFYRP